MFDLPFKEKDASTIPIPNIRFVVFEAMMRCIYTGESINPNVLIVSVLWVRVAESTF